MGTLLLVLLVLVLVGVFPAWPYNADWGHRPAGLIGVLLLVVVILWLTGNLRL